MNAPCVGFYGSSLRPHEFAWELVGRKWWLYLYGDPGGYTLTLGPSKTKRALCRKWALTFGEAH